MACKGDGVQRVQVHVEPDHIESLASGSAVAAVTELIWNALDAEATTVSISLELNEFDGIDGIIVSDDGHGMTHSEAIEEFGKLGGSWKRMAHHSRNGERILHGKHGSGRFKAFVLGGKVVWTTVTEQRGEREKLVVTGKHDAVGVFEISDPESTDDPPGTTVRVVANQSLQGLQGDAPIDSLTSTFALYLENYPSVTVRYGGRTVDAASLQFETRTYELSSEDGTPATLRVIEWTKDLGRKLVLADADGVALSETKAGVQAPGFDFTAYLQSDQIARSHPGNLQMPDADPVLAPLLDQSRALLSDHFRDRSRAADEEIVAEWKQDQVYPFAEEATTTYQRAERAVFDRVALTVHHRAPGFGSSGTANRRLALRLLREALERSPESVHKILTEVFGLPQEEQEAFAELLDRTSLSAIIRAAKLIADRLEFLTGLEHLVFGPTRDVLRERSELHRILANETWIFGEHYNLAVDDRSLTEVLRKHRELTGDETPVDSEVLDDEGRRRIVDLMLSAQARPLPRLREHLVVELKRPSVSVGMDEINQITKYATAVANDERFRQVDVHWTFMVVSNDMDGFAKRRAEQAHRPPGLVEDYGSLKIWVRTWAEILDSNRERLQYLQRELDYDPTTDQAMQYMLNNHAAALPGDVMAAAKGPGT